MTDPEKFQQQKTPAIPKNPKPQNAGKTALLDECWAMARSQVRRPPVFACMERNKIEEKMAGRHDEAAEGKEKKRR
jgi:hypothetical protein